MAQQQQKTGARDSRNPIADYITVAERIDRFYQRYPEGRIITHIVEHDAERGFILMRAEVYRQPDDALPAATGHAFEYRDQGQVNAKNYIENCESSAAGRALANCGFETKRGLGGQQAAMQTGPATVTDIRSAKESPAQKQPVLHGRPKLKTVVQELIKSLSTLGHPDFKKGDNQGARILDHTRKIARERNWDLEFRTLESINELTDAELTEYAAVLEGEIAVWKERLADDGVPA